MDQTVQRPSITGTELLIGPPDPAGDSVVNTGVESVFLSNSHATLPRTVTFAAPELCDQGGTHPLVIVVAAQALLMVGPFKSTRFTDSNGNLTWTYSDAAADMSIAVVAL